MPDTIGSPALWAGFVLFVLAMLALDLGIFHRRAHSVQFREAALWSVVWVSLALAFGGWVWFEFGRQAGLEFVTGYLIEKSLSVDNLFVFIVLFAMLEIPERLQHRVLFWGVIGALLLRAVMIFAGVALLAKFHWLIYLFGAFLIFTGAKLFRTWWRGAAEEFHESALLGWIRRAVPSTKRFEGQRFFTVENGRRVATPLLLALVFVETSDVVFALDSIPAIFAITLDPFIVFTSNIFAILGLRSLFFVLGGLITKFSDLKAGLSAVLIFIGAKMVLADVVKVPVVISLAVIAVLLGGAVVTSMLRDRLRARGSDVEKPGANEVGGARLEP